MSEDKLLQSLQGLQIIYNDLEVNQYPSDSQELLKMLIKRYLDRPHTLTEEAAEHVMSLYNHYRWSCNRTETMHRWSSIRDYIHALHGPLFYDSFKS